MGTKDSKIWLCIYWIMWFFYEKLCAFNIFYSQRFTSFNFLWYGNFILFRKRESDQILLPSLMTNFKDIVDYPIWEESKNFQVTLVTIPVKLCTRVHKTSEARSVFSGALILPCNCICWFSVEQIKQWKSYSELQKLSWKPAYF